MIKSNTKYLLLLLLLPFLFIFFGTRFERARYAGDPDYIYLMNALNLARGHDAGHIDNPGTPVMELGAALLHLHILFDSNSEKSLQHQVLENPDIYVNFIRQALILLIGFMMAWGAWVIFIRLKNVWMALLFQITPFLSVNVLEHAWTKVSPEPLLLAICLGYSIFLFRYLFRTSTRILQLIIGFSLLGGLGLATKATFLPILIIPFFLIPGWKNRGYYFLGTVAAFFLFTSPAHKEYHTMFDWFANLITHKGIYGKGEKGLVDISSYFLNIQTIFRVNLFFSLSFLLNGVFILWEIFKKNPQKSLFFLILKSLFAAQVLSVLIVAKHYHANHYLMPALALTGFSLIVLFLNIKEKLSPKIYRYLAPGFLALVAIWFFSISISELREKNEGYASTNEESEKTQQILKNEYSNYLKIYHYPDGLNAESALKFGNGYSKLSNQKGLNEVYPKAFFFNMILNKFEYWETGISVERLLRDYGTNWVITGRPFGQAAHNVLSGFGLKFNEVYRGMFQAIYVMDTAAMSPYLKSIVKRQEQKIICDFEQRSLDGSQFLAGNHTISTGYFQSEEYKRSENFSAKMDAQTEYALRLTINDIFPGQKFSCSIWQYPAGSKTYLIASAENSEVFYKASIQSEEYDSSGWQQLILNFSIPDEIPSMDHINLYIRKIDKSAIYLDDLEVICE